MKRVLFIRHYKLEPPYDKKKTISKEAQILLGRGKIDPRIHPDIGRYLQKNFSRAYFENFDLILSSPSRRSEESARAIRKIFELSLPIRIENNLREAIWDPALGPGRIRRFVEESGLSKISEVWKRFKALEQRLLKSKYRGILCVTHFFLIQNLYLYFVGGKRNYKVIKENDIRNSVLADYLKGFSVEL